MTTRNRWTAYFQTLAGKVESVTVYAAGRTRAGSLALFAAERRFGRIGQGLALIEEARA